MSADLQRLINQYMASADAPGIVVSQLASQMVDNQFTFLHFIQSLGSYLTDDSDAVRSKALTFIYEVIKVLPVNKLSMKDCHFLAEFFINRLDDDFKNAINGVESMVLMQNFKSFDLIDTFLHKIEEGYQPRQLLAKNRFAVFNVLLRLVQRYEQHLLSVSDLFIKTFIKVSTGEKDPKNLLISFELNYQISTKFTINQYAEDLFDNSFCYFPISFKPPANDPYKISSEQLKQALRKVLGCNSLFAKDCIPNLIEKLSSTSSSVKMDSLYSLIECIDNYSVEAIKEYSISIWNSLKYEVLHNELQNMNSYEDLEKKYENSEIEEDRVLPLTLALFRKLYVKINQNSAGDAEDEDVDVVIGEHMTTDIIIDELLKNLTTLDAQKSKQSILILTSLASTSLQSFDFIVRKTFPVLFSSQSLSVSLQRQLITYFKFFFDSCLALEISQPSPALLDCKDEIIAHLSKSLMSSSQQEVSLRCLAIQGFTKLANLPKFLDNQELNLTLQYLTDVLLTDENPTTSKEALNSIVQISATHSNAVIEVTVPRLLQLLPDDDESDTQGSNSKEKVLEIISMIVENKQLLDVITVRLLSKTSVVLRNSEGSVEYLRLLVSTMIDIITKTEQKAAENKIPLRLDDYLKNFLPQLLYLALSHDLFMQNDALLEIVSKLIKLIIVNTDTLKHQEIVNCMFQIFVEGQTSNPLLADQIPQSVRILDSPSKLIVLLTKAMSAVDKSTKLSVDVAQYVSQLIQICQSDSLMREPYTRLGYLLNLSVTLNKYFHDTALLKSLCDKLTIEPAASLDFYKNLEALTWITKGLILRDDPLAETCENYIVGLLSNDDARIAGVASKSIEVLIAKCEAFDTYTKTTTVLGRQKQIVFNLDIRLLYKQKFFNFVIPKLVKFFNDSESEALKKNYLVTLSLVLKYADTEVMATHINQVFPLVLKSLFFAAEFNQHVIKYSLNVVLMSFSQDASLVTADLRKIVPRLLELINDDRCSEDIKVTSLQCLIEVADKISLNTVMDYREGIIRNLGYTLDDKKRSIRKLAADCRQLYYDLAQVKD